MRWLIDLSRPDLAGRSPIARRPREWRKNPRLAFELFRWLLCSLRICRTPSANLVFRGGFERHGLMQYAARQCLNPCAVVRPALSVPNLVSVAVTRELCRRNVSEMYGMSWGRGMLP